MRTSANVSNAVTALLSKDDAIVISSNLLSGYLQAAQRLKAIRSLLATQAPLVRLPSVVGQQPSQPEEGNSALTADVQVQGMRPAELPAPSEAVAVHPGWLVAQALVSVVRS